MRSSGCGDPTNELMETFKDRFQIEDGKLIHKLNDETLIVEAWGPDGLRIRGSSASAVPDTPWALTEHPSSWADRIDPAIVISETEATIRNGKISLRISDIYTQKAYMQFFRHTADGTTCILNEQDYVVHAHNPGTRIYKPIEDGLHHTEVHFAARESERFYGLGLNATDTVNLKGCVIDLYQRHVKHVVPFLVSSEGYGFLWNNPSLGRAELGRDRTRWVSEGCRKLDYYVTTGDSYAEILEHYADVTGHAPEFPYWASGFWQCKLRYKNQDEFLGIAREFKKRSLPLAVLVIDFLHWEHTGDWKLDPTYWPDPGAMVRELDEMGVRIMISPWILVDEKSENFRYMMDNGLFTGSTDGNRDTVEFGGVAGESKQKYQYDPTNPKAAEFLWNRWKKNYFDIGIRTFWLDPCDDFHSISDYDRVLYHIGTGVEAHGYFPVAHQRNVYEGLLDAGEREIVTICRSSWAGSQRYGASPAAHDIMSSFEHLRTYMKAGLNLAMSGIPWGAAEIGGFVTHENHNDRFYELMIRWYQYGVFTPVFRTHGNRPNNEPWTVGGDTYAHITAALELRERLRPYVMEQMRLASERGIPPMRPVFFDFSHDPRTYDVEDQFLFGPDILVAPIVEYGTREREVYLPSGVDWTDVWTGRRIPGGEALCTPAPIEHIPIFIRGENSDLLRCITDGF